MHNFNLSTKEQLISGKYLQIPSLNITAPTVI